MTNKAFGIIACISTLLLVACGGDGDSDSNPGNPMTAATDGVYNASFTWTFRGNNRAPGNLTMTFAGDMVTVRRGSLTGSAQFSGGSYTVTEKAPECGWIYTGTVGAGATAGTISAANCPGPVTGSYSGTR